VAAEARLREQRGDLLVARRGVDAAPAERDQARAQVAPLAHDAEPLAAHDPLEAVRPLARGHTRACGGEEQHSAPRGEQSDHAEQEPDQRIHRYTDLTMRQSTRLPSTWRPPEMHSAILPAGSAIMRPRYSGFTIIT